MSAHQPGKSDQRLEQAGASDENIVSTHAILLREKQEPTEGFSRMPLFVLLLVATLVFICCIYIVHYRGGFSPLVYDDRFDPATMGGGNAGPKVLTPEELVKLGKIQFSSTCATCHQITGQGLPGTYPPLASSEWVNGPEEHVVRIVLLGLTGPVTVKGSTFNGAMPAFGKVPGGGYNWSDEKIAAVLSYVRQEWGNSAPPIAVDTVASIREEIVKERGGKSWSEEELKAVPVKSAAEKAETTAPAGAAPAKPEAAPAKP